MPEYLAPGVIVEEVSYRSKSIEGVGTTTAGFIGPTRDGPTDVEPGLVTSLGEYERVFGDGRRLRFADAETPTENYMWHAARAFFENGGARLYVQRVFEAAAADEGSGFAGGGVLGDGDATVTIRSRFPGAAGARRVRITLDAGPNALALESPPGEPTAAMTTVVRGLRDRDVVWISRAGSSPSPDAERSEDFYLASLLENDAGISWSFAKPAAPAQTLQLGDLTADLSPDASDQVRVVSATVTVLPAGDDDLSAVWSGLALDPGHTSFDAPDSLTHQFHPRPDDVARRRTVPIVIETGDEVTNGLRLLYVLLGRDADGASADPPTPLDTALSSTGHSAAERTLTLLLGDGDDGVRPSAARYEGEPGSIDDKSGLRAFEDLEDVAIVAAPGSTFGYEDPAYKPQAATIVGLLIAHAERMRYRIAVVDSGDGQDVSQVRAMRAALDSKHAALYYPWVRVLDPVSRQEVHLPPSGFVAGIYARNDSERGVYKAPANEVVTLALGFERTLNTAQQEVLNPEGINCLRYFEGRGNRVWGARTVSSDPDWRYVSVRRYLAYLERSIDIGTQWAVFEPNAPELWTSVRRTIADFLFDEFLAGAFTGAKPESSYFVRCDRSTMTQRDLDTGRLVCHVGVAVVRPAEFVILRIGLWTADAKSQ